MALTLWLQLLELPWALCLQLWTRRNRHTRTRGPSFRGSAAASFEHVLPLLQSLRSKRRSGEETEEKNRKRSSRKSTDRPVYPLVNNSRQVPAKKIWQPVMSHRLSGHSPTGNPPQATTKIPSIPRAGVLQGRYSSSKEPHPSSSRVASREEEGKHQADSLLLLFVAIQISSRRDPLGLNLFWLLLLQQNPRHKIFS